jgi:hypothetical protein
MALRFGRSSSLALRPRRHPSGRLLPAAVQASIRAASLVAMLSAASASAATFNWTGAFVAIDNNWDTDFNWSPNGVPGASDNIVLSNTANVSVVNLNGNRSINSVTFSSFTNPFTLFSSTLTLSGGVTSTNSVASPHIIGSNLSLPGATTWNIDELAPVTVSGSISGAGGINMIGTGTLILTNASSSSGAVSINEGTLQLDGQLTPSGNVNVAAAGTLNLLTTGVLNGNGTGGVGGISGGPGAPGRSVTTAGTLAMSGSGQLNLLGGNGGEGNPLDGGTGGAGGNFSITGGTATLANSTVVNLTGGAGGFGSSIFSAGGTGGIGGIFSVAGGTTSFSGSSVVNLNGGNGGVGNDGGAGGSGGVFSVTAGVASLSGSSVVRLTGGAGADGRGDIGLAPGGPGGTGGAVNLSGGTFDMIGGQVRLAGGPGGSGLLGPGATGVAGQINITGGTFNFTAGQITANTGVTPATPASLVQATINISAGAMNLLGDFTNSSGTINLTSTGAINGNGANGANNGASIGVPGGAATPGRSITTSGPLAISGSSQLNLNGGVGGSGGFNTLGGLGGAGGALNIAGGATSLSDASVLNLNGGAAGPSGAAGFGIAAGNTGGAGGTLVVSSGTTFSLDQSAQARLQGGNGGAAGGAGGTGGTLSVAGGTATIAGTSVLRLTGGTGGAGNPAGVGGTGGAGGAIQVASGALNITGGSIALTGGAGGTASLLNGTPGAAGAAGSISVSGGTMTMTGGEVTTGSFTRSGSGVFNFNGGTLHVQTFNGDLTNSGGSLAPGTSAGLTTVNGNYTQNSGALAIELGGTGAGQFDKLTITGNTTLGGALNVSLIDSFLPTLGQSWGIIDVGGTRTGAFTGLPQAAQVGAFGGVNLFVNYASGDGNDVALVATRPGDFNLDYRVDGADFLAWQRDPAIGNLSDWQTNFGLTAPLTAASTAVPEPGSMMMIIAGLTLLGSFTIGRVRNHRGG